MVCPACGHGNPASAQFCNACGARLDATCPACGNANPAESRFCNKCGAPLAPSGSPARPARDAPPATTRAPTAAEPGAFCEGRYEVKRLLGEGGKKRVYLAHDTKLDRDVAFALIKTDGLDEEGLLRVKREAQAMGRLGDHPHIVSVHDIGEEAGQPYIVTQLMAGGDVEALIQKAEGHRVPLDTALRVADQVCQALEHAHGNGIVHRDLKPGNVWLTADGTVKLGDFGLAVVLDRSRLTQAGMMVGTAHYMPPEQAMGGDVTPRSDLYSLGAMLYEMVTGRPPFVGDESVAIITQHLNTPPVSPAWHAPGLSPGLEALILRLLEKDPAKRPVSAREVRQMLAGATALSPTPPPTLREGRTGSDGSPLPTLGEGSGVRAASPQPHGESPVYQRTFVGREQELRQLQGAFDAAISGQGSLAMVVGEPGIGKTSLCEQLATYVAVRGGKALVGHCYEEGSLSIPYLPFVEAMRSYVLARDPDGLRHDLGSGAAEVARLVSEIRDRLALSPGPSPNLGGGGAGASPDDDDRWRLLQAVSGFLHNASAVQPLLIVLEDLHDADRGTLDLLLHLARNLQVVDSAGRGARLLLVGTYRDVEVDRSHPLSGALAELRRSSSFLRVPLRGLTVDEVQRMMSIVRGQEVPWSRAEAIHRQTEGNPLFVQEVLRYLVEEGIVVREGGRYVLSDPASPDAGIPEGLRDVVGKRLSRLSEKANQVLSVASVIGRDFRLDVLQRVANLPEEELFAALEEATERAVVEQRQSVGAVGFRFTHAFFRQTLYDEIFVPRRIRTHQQVGNALEDVYGRRLEEHAAELAEHFVQSTEPGDLEKALRYSELAAQRAMAVFAYGEAVRHLGQALRTQEVLDPDDRGRRCDLLLRQAEAMLPLEDPRQVAETVAEEAFALADDLGDPTRAARASILALEAIWRAGRGAIEGTMPSAEMFQRWAARADSNAQPDTADRVYADIYLGIPGLGGRLPAVAHPFLRRGVDRALELGDNGLFLAAAGWGLARLQALRDRPLIEGLAREVRDRPRDGARTTDLGQCLFYGGDVLLECGDRAGAEALWRELEQLAARTRDAWVAILALTGPIALDFLDGRLEEGLAHAEAARARGRELGIVVLSNRWGLLRHLGRLTAEDIERELAGTGRPGQAARALLLAEIGHHEEARAVYQRFANVGSDEDESSIHVLGPVFAAAILGGDLDTVPALAPRFVPLADRVLVGGAPASGSVARLLGSAAALLGKPEEARAYFGQALEACERLRHRPEIALTHLAFAELLLDEAVSSPLSAISDGGDGEKPTADALKAEGSRHLDFAIEELQAMKMQPALERALRHKGLLRA